MSRNWVATRMAVSTWLLCFFLFGSFSYADTYTANASGSEPAAEDSTSKYIKTLGEYMGYDLETSVAPYEYVLDPTYSLAMTGLQMLESLFASIPVNSDYKKFIDNDSYSAINNQANILFTNYHSANGADVSATAGFDEPTQDKSYQSDPVSQMVYNIVGTPNSSTCSSDNANIQCLNQNEVMQTVISDISSTASDSDIPMPPGETTYFSSENIKKYLSQLNVNTLMSPLIYSTNKEESSSPTSLPGANQLQQAATFIRYVTAAVLPPDTMSESNYNSLWSEATKSTKDQDKATVDNILSSRTQLATYLISQRVYAAQSSVAISNIYNILAKRMPQSTGTDSGGQPTYSSQAFNEFQMATWRLHNFSEKSAENQWVNRLNTASASTVAKESAVLLSEINYQLYLNRQMEERVLLTNSLQLLQLLMNSKPNTEPLNAASVSGEAPSD